MDVNVFGERSDPTFEGIGTKLFVGDGQRRCSICGRILESQ